MPVTRLLPIPALLCLIALTPPEATAADPAQIRNRAYELDHPDLSKSFDLRLSSYGGRSFNTTDSPEKSRSFFFRQKTAPKEFQTREFQDSKPSWFSKLPFFTKSADTRGKYDLAFRDKKVETRALPVGESRFARKALPVRSLPGGDRPYLGPETDRAAKPVPPANPPTGWRGNLTEIKTVEEVRELLNKNK